MRNFINILSLVLVYGLTIGLLSGQNSPKAEYWVLDSLQSYSGDASNQWILEKRVLPVQRNQIGFLTVAQEYYDADYNGNWQRGDSIVYTYYNDTRTAEVVNFPYVNGTWEDTSYCVRYDTEKRRTFYLSHYYNYTANPPARSSGIKTYYFYTVSGKDSLKISYFYNGSSWEKKEKYVYEYKTNGDLENYTIYKWNASWQPYKKYVYYYDNAVVVGKIIYYYDAAVSSWALSQRIYYYYNSDTTLLEYETQESRNTSTDTWEFAYKTVYVYDNDSVLTSKILYNYNLIIGWIEYRKYEYHYDINGNLTIYKTLSWDGSNWVNVRQTTYVYNSVNYMIEYANYNWDDVNDEWEKVFRKDFYYSAVQFASIDRLINNKMMLYPNPSTGIVNIKGMDNPVVVEVYNLRGAKIAVFDVSANKKFNIQLLPQGYYIIKVKSADNTITERKLLKL